MPVLAVLSKATFKLKFGIIYMLGKRNSAPVTL